ncbi:MAG: hypothetical protein Tsb008_15060 [Rhodothalassiaceae bacterium]
MAYTRHKHLPLPQRPMPENAPLAASGHRPLIEQIILEHQRRYLAYLRWRLSSAEDVEDVFQDFCVKALARAEQVRDVATAEAWMQRVLFSVLQDFYRSKGIDRRGRAEIEQAAHIEAQMVPEPASEAEDTHVCACVKAHLPKLKPEYRAVLWQADFLDIPRSEVARRLDMSIGNLRVRLHRARKALRATLKKVCPTCAEGMAQSCHFATRCNASGAHPS